MKLSLAITTFNRYEMTIASFEKVVDDPRITEIVISDDVSTDGSAEKLQKTFYGHPKVLVHWNRQNKGMSLNKLQAISLCKRDFVIVLDSDNILNTDYLDALEKVEVLDPYFIYMPEFAFPEFNFSVFKGLTINRGNVKDVISTPMGNVMFNACNYVVPRENYIQTYRHNKLNKATDTIHFNKLWLEAGFNFYVVPDMVYKHTVHPGSGFLEDVHYNMNRAEQIRQEILNM